MIWCVVLLLLSPERLNEERGGGDREIEFERDRERDREIYREKDGSLLEYGWNKRLSMLVDWRKKPPPNGGGDGC